MSGWSRQASAAVGLAVLAAFASGGARAQPAAPPAAPAPDPAFVAAQAAFDALPEAERKAIQEQLIWTGDFAGAGTGGFGPLTWRGIQAFQKRAGAKVDGILKPQERAALDKAAAQARETVRFTRVSDAKSGIRIGVPQRLLDRTRTTPEGAVFASADGAATLAIQAPAGELTSLYDALKADGPKRRVTYKVLRPDWFVVSGEAEGRRFYTRMNQTTGGLRGYTFTYPAARAPEFDRLSIAIANSFEATPAAVAAAPGESPASSRQQPQDTSPMRPVDAMGHLTGFVLSPGLVATSAFIDRCRAPKIGRTPVRVRSHDAAKATAFLDTAAVPAPRGHLPTAVPADGDPLVVLEQVMFGRELQLAVIPGEARMSDTSRPRIVAPLQPGAAGAAVFDRNGAFVGLVAGVPAEPRLVAGVMPQASWPLLTAASILAEFRREPEEPSVQPVSQSAGAIAERYRDRVVAITCGG